MLGSGRPGVDQPLTRNSHWFEVQWGQPQCFHVFYLAVHAFHPSQEDAEARLRADAPGIAEWLDVNLPGRWRFVTRSAAYANDVQSDYVEHLFLFDGRADGVRLVEAHAHAILRSRLAYQPCHSVEDLEQAALAREQVTRLLALEPAELVPVLLRETPPLTSNTQRWTQGGTWGVGPKGTTWTRIMRYAEPGG